MQVEETHPIQLLTGSDSAAGTQQFPPLAGPAAAPSATSVPLPNFIQESALELTYYSTSVKEQTRMLPPDLKAISLTIREHYSQRKNFISFQSALLKEVSVLQQ